MLRLVRVGLSLVSRSARLAVSVVIACLLLAATSACSEAPEVPPTRKLVSTEDAVRLYDERASTLSFPTEMRWPSLQTKAVDGVAFDYTAGDVVVEVENNWLCGWQLAWVNRLKNNRLDSAEAIGELAKFSEFATYTTSYDSATREAFDERLAQARLGDPTLIRQDSILNCRQFS